MGKIIAVIGNTGIGKTTLVKALSNDGGYSTGTEQHYERPFQNLFQDNPTFALANQVDYLLFRAEQELSLRQSPEISLVDGGLDQDFFVFTRLFHEKGMLSKNEFDLCRRLYHFFRLQLPKPDLIIYLTASCEVIQRRLANRDRINIAKSSDLDLINSYLEDWISTIPQDSVLHYDISTISMTFQEILPNLKKQIAQRMDQNHQSYEIDYIP